MSLDSLKERFGSIISRETRFGGLQLRRVNWQFDVWPLHKTWTFLRDKTLEATFASLPYTTFFNLEAIAVDVWATPGGSRTVYCGDDQFFDGLLSRVIEINREENPFPALCVVRALVMASSLRFSIGPQLARYLAQHGPELKADELEETQRKHYGAIRRSSSELQEWIEHVRRSVDSARARPVVLPVRRQQTFWPEDRIESMKFNLHAL